jgi:hypothetical protein
MEETVLNRQDLKELLGVKNLRLKALIAQGLPHITLNAGRGSVVFLKSSVLAWLKSLELPKSEPKQREAPQRMRLANG